jgi:biopolymer transport protein ExbB/TolQ
MWFILALAIVAAGIMAERVLALYIRRKPTQKRNVLSFEKGIRQGDLETVMTTSQQNLNEPINRTVAAGTHAAMNLGGKDEIQGRMEEVILEETEQIEKRTGFLAMIANVATLAGLLGTITGMIKAFAAVSNANPMEKATLLSNGISEAMNTTAFGLIVAIPTLLVYSILANRSQTLTDDLNQAALKAYNWLSYSFNPLETRKTQTPKTN